MMPSHFAERFGLIVIIALGESIVAIGVGVDTAEVDAGIVVAAVLGTVVAAALWWLYFDVVALVAERRLSRAAPGRERNSIGRDSYGYLHMPMVAGIVLLALGMKKTLGHVEEPLKLVPAVALLGGTALYLSPTCCSGSATSTAQRPAAALRGAAVRADPGRGRAGGARHAGDPRRAAGGADRLRDGALRRGARPPAPRGRAGARGLVPRLRYCACAAASRLPRLAAVPIGTRHRVRRGRRPQLTGERPRRALSGATKPASASTASRSNRAGASARSALTASSTVTAGR